MSANNTHEEIYGIESANSSPLSHCPPDWLFVAWRRLEAGEKIEAGDWVDKAPDGWRGEPEWAPVRSNEIGQSAPDPAYPAHRIFRRVLREDFKTRRNVAVVLYRTTDGCRIEWGTDVYVSEIPFVKAAEMARNGQMGKISKKWIGKFN